MRHLSLAEAISGIKLNKLLIVALDFESWEQSRNSGPITEIGVSIYEPSQPCGTTGADCWGNGVMPLIRPYHFIVEDNYRLRNGRYVPDHKDYFALGSSFKMSYVDCVSTLQQVISDSADIAHRDLVIVAHSVTSELQYLKMLGIDLPDHTLLLDTAKLFQDTKANFSSLEKALTYLEIPHSLLHNAGNDAYYTLLLALCLCNETFRQVKELDSVVPTLSNQMKSQLSKKGRKRSIPMRSDEAISNIFPSKKIW